jgi:hypothetical protein
MVEQMTLAEAYEQRAAIEQAARTIYVEVRPTGIVYRLEFREAQQPPHWYRVILFRAGERKGHPITLPGRAPVTVE